MDGIKPYNPRIIVPRKLVTCIDKAVKWGVIFGGHPFKWNEAHQRSEVGSRRQQLLWALNMIAALAHLMFVWIRCIQVGFDVNIPRTQAIYMRFMAAYYSLGGILHLGVLINRSEISAFLNQYLRFTEEFEKKFVRKDSKPPTCIKMIESIMMMVNVCIPVTGVLITTIAFLRPRSQEQIASLLQESASISYAPRLLSTLLIAYIEYLYGCSALIVIQTVFVFLTHLVMFEEMNPGTSSVTFGRLRQKPELLKLYRWLQMQTKWFNQIFGELIIPSAKILMMLWCVLCTYGALRTHGVQSLVLGFMAQFSFSFIVVTFTFLGEVKARSSAVIRRWLASCLADSWFRRSVRALPILAVNLHGAYDVDRLMVLTMVDIIASQTVAFLLLNG